VAPNFPGMRKHHSSGNNSSNDESNQTQVKMRRMSGSNASLYGTDVIIEEQRMMVQSLAEHIVYSKFGKFLFLDNDKAYVFCLTFFKLIF
jgi:hypothetical protein